MPRQSFLFHCFLWKLKLSRQILLCNKEVISRSSLCWGRKIYWCNPQASKRASLNSIFPKITWENKPNALLWRVVSSAVFQAGGFSFDIYCAGEVYQKAWILHSDFWNLMLWHTSFLQKSLRKLGWESRISSFVMQWIPDMPLVKRGIPMTANHDASTEHTAK